MGYRYNTDFAQTRERLASQGFASKPWPAEVDKFRAGAKESMKGMPAAPLPEGITLTIRKVVSYDGATISVSQLAPKNQAANSPAILHCHGGGMVSGTPAMSQGRLGMQSIRSNVPIFSVDYRLAPEFPHPTPTEDAYAALTWLKENARELGIDAARIAVMGDSAGAGIVAGVTLMARDRHFSPPLAKQILIYPMLDHTKVQENKALSPWSLPMWNSHHNAMGWAALLGEDHLNREIEGLEYASPIFAKSLKDLPDAYIDVGGLDLFRDEDLRYACRLSEEGQNNVELHVYPGLPHGFEMFIEGTTTLQNILDNRVAAMTSF